MSILNSWMFKSSRSPPLSLQKQQFQFEREKQRKNKTPAASWLFFSSPWPGKERHLWFECAWGSTVCFHFKPTWQTNSDRFVPLFSLLLLLSLSQIMRKHAAQIYYHFLSVCMFSCSICAHTHTRAYVHGSTNTHTYIQTNPHQKKRCQQKRVVIENWETLFRFNSLIPLMAS